MFDERKIVERKKARVCQGAVEEFEESAEEGYCVLMMGRDRTERGEAGAFPQCFTTHSLAEMGGGPRSEIPRMQK